jgi:hypothetical protein
MQRVGNAEKKKKKLWFATVQTKPKPRPLATDGIVRLATIFRNGRVGACAQADGSVGGPSYERPNISRPHLIDKKPASALDQHPALLVVRGTRTKPTKHLINAAYI